MHLGAATRRRDLVLAFAAVAAACSSAPPTYSPGKLSPEQLALCRDTEQAYHEAELAQRDAAMRTKNGSAAPELTARAEESSRRYEELRSRVVADPVAAAWLVRVFVRDLMVFREGRPLGEGDELFRAAAGITNPTETRAIAEVKRLGGLAVPTLVGDLLLHDQPMPRELGIELLSAIGLPALPALQQIARTGEVRPRRAAARTLGRIQVDAEVLGVLRELASDADFSVRADALRSITSGGEPARQLLIERLQQDEDPFVRRIAAQSLASFPGRASAMALVAFLERCRREPDSAGEVAAQKALQRLAGERRLHEPAEWKARNWPDVLPAAPEGARKGTNS